MFEHRPCAVIEAPISACFRACFGAFFREHRRDAPSQFDVASRRVLHFEERLRKTTEVMNRFGVRVRRDERSTDVPMG